MFTWCFINVFDSIIQECNGRSLPNSIEDSFHFEVQTNVPHKYIETLQLKPGHIFDVGKTTIIVNTLVCEAGKL